MDRLGKEEPLPPQMVDLAETMACHSDGIIASISLGLSSGSAEGLNTKIRAAFRRAFGFKAPEYRDTMIYMTAGRIGVTHAKLKRTILMV